MTASPRLPAGFAGEADDNGAEGHASAAELDRMVELAVGRQAGTVAIGSGRARAELETAAAMAGRWEAAGGIVLDTVTWPEEAASWLRQATRFAAADPDLWIMAGSARGWAQMTRRLLWSTPWRPERTIAFAAIGRPATIELVGACNLTGLTGSAADGQTWTVRDGRVQAGRADG